MIAEKIKLERAKAELTLSELSIKSSVTIQTIHRIETGKCKPGLVTLGKLANALNIDVGKFLNDKLERGD